MKQLFESLGMDEDFVSLSNAAVNAAHATLDIFDTKIKKMDSNVNDAIQQRLQMSELIATIQDRVVGMFLCLDFLCWILMFSIFIFRANVIFQINIDKSCSKVKLRQKIDEISKKLQTFEDHRITFKG